jgi:hypothetical protein
VFRIVKVTFSTKIQRNKLTIGPYYVIEAMIFVYFLTYIIEGTWDVNE